jgi:hypothetical protein
VNTLYATHASHDDVGNAYSDKDMKTMKTMKPMKSMKTMIRVSHVLT